MVSHSLQPLLPQIKKVAAEGAVGGTVYGLTANEWVAVATISYITLQAAYLIWKWRKEAKSYEANAKP